MRITEIVATRIDCFCEHVIKRGTPLFMERGSIQYSFNLATPKVNQEYLGISLVDVIPIDYMHRYAVSSLQVCSGSKVEILVRGKITIHLPKSYGILPVGQPIYWDGKRFTWKVLSPLIGKVISSSKDGSCILGINAQ